MEKEQSQLLDSKSRIWIYTGPSLSMAEAQRLAPDARVLPPAKRGDLVFAEQEDRPEIVVLIDGAFLNTLTASPREILAVMQLGIKVIGSSSLGAIRAVELESLGMIGVGRVFEMYRDEVIISDDEVAMAMDPESGIAMSEPLVHFRVLLEHAAEQGIVSHQERDRVFSEIQQLYFPQRTHEAFYKRAGAVLRAEQVERLRGLAETCPYRVKRLDAIAAIEQAYQVLTVTK